MGVFLWGTNSVQDIFVGPGQPGFTAPENSTILRGLELNKNLNLTVSSLR